MAEHAPPWTLETRPDEAAPWREVGAVFVVDDESIQFEWSGPGRLRIDPFCRLIDANGVLVCEFTLANQRAYQLDPGDTLHLLTSSGLPSTERIDIGP